MSASIKVGWLEATITGYTWTGNDEGFVRYLNSLLSPFGPPGEDPAPDYNAALDAAKRMHGEVIEYTLPKYVSGRVY